MNSKSTSYRHVLSAAVATFSCLLLLATAGTARGQCPAPGIDPALRTPLGITLSKKNNLLVAETGRATINSGRISIVTPAGDRRTLIDGLPSGINPAENQYTGPTGIFLRNRTLYVLIGEGDTTVAGPIRGTQRPNPNPSSPIFASVLAIHFSAAIERMTQGFTLTPANQQTLSQRQPVTLTNSALEQIRIELVAKLPNTSPAPRPDDPDNVRSSNPFDLVAVGNRIFVADGGQNRIWRVDLPSGSFRDLVTFPPIPNPTPIGPPVIEAVPTGITFADGKLLVTLFRGFPFPAGTSTVQQVDPQTGSNSPLISGLKTAIDVLPIQSDTDANASAAYLVLEHSSGATMLSGLGRLLRFSSPTAAPVVISDCIPVPTSMALDPATGTLYMTQLSGRIATIAVAAEPYNTEAGVPPTFLSISSRSRVQSGDDVMIAGFNAGQGTTDGSSTVVVRAIGPSLTSYGLSNVLQNPTLQVYDRTGTLVASNDDWMQTQRAEIEATGLAPGNPMESAILLTVPPGAYTAIIRGVGNTTGIALLEVYSLR